MIFSICLSEVFLCSPSFSKEFSCMKCTRCIYKNYLMNIKNFLNDLLLKVTKVTSYTNERAKNTKEYTLHFYYKS